jgi:hypothetical protein
MSEFAFLFHGSHWAEPADVQRANLQRWAAWMKDLGERGLITNPGQPLEYAGKFVTGQAKVITDGPFAEAKDVISGFIVIKAADAAEAADIAKGCPILDAGGAVEVRPVRILAMAPA